MKSKQGFNFYFHTCIFTSEHLAFCIQSSFLWILCIYLFRVLICCMAVLMVDTEHQEHWNPNKQVSYLQTTASSYCTESSVKVDLVRTYRNYISIQKCVKCGYKLIVTKFHSGVSNIRTPTSSVQLNLLVTLRPHMRTFWISCTSHFLLLHHLWSVQKQWSSS